MTLTSPDILKPFGLKKSELDGSVFGGELIRLSRYIRETFVRLRYDHKPLLPKVYSELHGGAILTEEYRVGFACFKYAVSMLIQPSSIFEIGVGPGISALAFLQATPTAYYTGVDNGEYETLFSFPFSNFVSDRMKNAGYNFKLHKSDISKIVIPHVDLIHVDGSHAEEDVEADVLQALTSHSKWILLDDARDTSVLSGFAKATRHFVKGVLDWAYFEDTWSGNILIRNNS